MLGLEKIVLTFVLNLRKIDELNKCNMYMHHCIHVIYNGMFILQLKMLMIGVS